MNRILPSYKCSYCLRSIYRSCSAIKQHAKHSKTCTLGSKVASNVLSNVRMCTKFMRIFYNDASAKVHSDRLGKRD